MLTISQMQALSKQASVRSSLLPIPRPLGHVIVKINATDSYLSRTGLIMTDRKTVPGWDNSEDAHTFAEQRGEFFGDTELRVEIR